MTDTEERLTRIEQALISLARDPWVSVGVRDNLKSFRNDPPVENGIATNMKARIVELESWAAEMREVLFWLHQNGGLGLDVHDRIEAVLNKRKTDV